MEMPLWCTLLLWELTCFLENLPQHSSSCRQLAIAKDKGNNSSGGVYYTTKVLDWNVPSLCTAQHCAGPKTPTDAPCMQCLWVCACQGLHWGPVSSHHCVGAGEGPRAPAKGPPHIGREWLIQGWGPTPQLCWLSQKPSKKHLLIRKFSLTKL